MNGDDISICGSDLDGSKLGSVDCDGDGDAGEMAGNVGGANWTDCLLAFDATGLLRNRWGEIVNGVGIQPLIPGVARENERGVCVRYMLCEMAAL